MSKRAEYVAEKLQEGQVEGAIARAENVRHSFLRLLGGAPLQSEADATMLSSRSFARFLVDDHNLIRAPEGGWYDRHHGPAPFEGTSLTVWEVWPRFEAAFRWLAAHPGEPMVTFSTRADGLGRFLMTVVALPDGYHRITCHLLDHTHLGGDDEGPDRG